MFLCVCVHGGNSGSNDISQKGNQALGTKHTIENIFFGIVEGKLHHGTLAASHVFT